MEPKTIAMILAVIEIEEERGMQCMIFLLSTREGLTLYKGSLTQAPI